MIVDEERRTVQHLVEGLSVEIVLTGIPIIWVESMYDEATRVD